MHILLVACAHTIWFQRAQDLRVKGRTLLTFNPQISIPVSTQADEWTAAEVLRDEFTHVQTTEDAIETTAALENTTEASVELLSRFLSFVAGKLDEDAQSEAARTSILLKSLKYFTASYLSTQDIHVIVAAFDTEVRKTVLAAYFQALAALEAKNVPEIPRAPSSALLSAATRGDASIYALFGGQGTNEVYFDELQILYDIYKPYVSSFVTTITKDVLTPLVEESEEESLYTHGLDIISWLSGASPRPPVAYLASIPVSFPLIAVTQLTQFLVVCRVAQLTPGDVRSRLHGATGHSQGLVSALAIAASTTFESFYENASKSVRWSFYSGLRGQQAFPVLALEPSIVEDSVEGGEGAPSPMLSITGLSLKDLESHIGKTNKHLPENSKIGVSLHNGPKAFVITGPPRSLYGLVTHLRKVRAPSGLDQSKTPFSQRKPVFSVRFLVVGVPYHSKYLEDVADEVMDDLENQELWTKEDLGIPVYHTENGMYALVNVIANTNFTFIRL